jgi:acylphosphatase
MTAEFGEAISTRLVKVWGVVQGIGYRQACIQQARALGVTGWVRNHIDGSVEAILQGSADQLDRMCDWMGEGMTDALVDKLEVVEVPPPFARFGEFKLATAI